MAEARSAVSYRVEKSNLTFQITEDELVLRINKNVVPSSFSRFRRSLIRRLNRSGNAWTNLFYPAPPLHWALLITAPASIMLAIPPSSSPQALSTSLSASASASSSSLWARTSDHVIELLQPVSDKLWSLTRFIPVSDSTLQISSYITADISKVAIVSVTLGTSAILCISYLRRFLLRALLGYQGWLYEEPKQTTLATTIWGLLVKIISGQHSFRLVRANPLLFSNQQSLPRIPVPSVEATCQKYLNSVRPLLSDEEYAHMQQLVHHFKEKEAGRLQFYLKMKSWFSDNYVADWWEKYVYLKGRSPIVVNSNYYILDTLKEPATKVQVARAANLVHHILEFKDRLDRETLAPMMIRGTVPMCMAQYERMFSTTRIPGKDADTLEHDEYDVITHIVVLRKGNFYALDLYDENGNQLTAPEIEVQLKWIMYNAEHERPTEAEASIPALTCENRTVWANAREEFFSYGVNRQSLDLIEKSMFVLVLDDEDSGPYDEWTKMGCMLFHGSGTNRWVDKSFNVVVFPNGRAGVNVEHSWADAPVLAHMWEHAIISGDNPLHYDENGFNLRERPLIARPPPQRLRWDLTQRAEKVIETAVNNTKKFFEDVDLNIVQYKPYGKGFIKKCKVSPDAYVQMAMQIAYKRDSGKFALTYESSMTRLFRLGRTETVRPVSLASAEFVNSFDDPSIPKKDKIALLSKAAESHQQYYRDCMTGKGIDRHLFGLYVVSQGMGVESQFLKSALSMEWKLSTSQQPQGQTGLFNPSNKAEIGRLSPGGGFGPVSDSGYGVSYMIAGEEHLVFHISSKKSSPVTDSTRFGKAIFQALDELKVLFEK